MGKKLARGSREHTYSPFDGRVTLHMVSNHPKGQRIFPEFANLPLRTPGTGVLSELTFLPRVRLGPGAHALLRYLLQVAVQPGDRWGERQPRILWLLPSDSLSGLFGVNQWPPAYSDMSYEVIKQEVIWPEPIIGFPRVSAFLQENMIA